MGLFWLIWDQAPSMSLADQLRKIQGANKEKVEADAPSSSLLALFNGQSATEPTTRKRTRNSLEEEPAAPPAQKSTKKKATKSPLQMPLRPLNPKPNSAKK